MVFQVQKKCTSFNERYFKVEGDNNEYCNLPEEIINIFGKKYFKNNEQKYDKYDESCSTCINSANNCLNCSENYYFVEGFGNVCKREGQIDENYFLPFKGDTYYECDSYCKTCIYRKDYCTNCNDPYIIFDNINK